MKRFVKNFVAVVVMLAFSYGVKAQFAYSSVVEYGEFKGTGALVRVDHANDYYVTCQNTEHNCSQFMVSDGVISRYLTTTKYVPNPMMLPTLPLNSGYEVKAMEIVGTTCWFAGTHWWETGEILFGFGFGGAPYMEVKYRGFIGCFDVTDVLSGNGTYKVQDITGTYEISRMAAYLSGVAAIGRTEDGATRLVELKVHETGLWSYGVGKSTNAEEVFMDIANVGGQMVALSRYNNPVHIMYYKYMFGLRYETIGGLLSSQQQYVYDTYDAYSDPRAAFVGVLPIFLNHTKRGNEVLVSYLGSWNMSSNSLVGELIMFRIPSRGGVVAEVISGANNVKCTELKEVRFDNALSEYANLTLLATDVYGNSVMRFPYLYKSGIYNDTALFSNSSLLESISPFQSSNLGFDVIATGYDVSSGKLVSIREYSIHDRIDYMNSHDCFQMRVGHFHSYYNSRFTPVVRSHPMEVLYQSGMLNPGQKTFQSFPVTRRPLCENGNQM